MQEKLMTSDGGSIFAAFAVIGIGVLNLDEQRRVPSFGF
jgi:hypothetical protein